MSLRDEGGGSSDNWVPAVSDVKVDIKGIQDFATLIGHEIKDQFQVNMQTGIEPMMRIRAPMGGGSLKEGAFFQQMHVRELKAAGDLLRDVALGMSSLSAAALAIYADYLGGDNLSSATVDDVMNAFYPGPGQQTLQGHDADDPASPVNDSPNYDPADDPRIPADIRAVIIAGESGGGGGTGDQYDPSAPQTVGTGSGAYTIQGDYDKMNDAPTDPVLNQ